MYFSIAEIQSPGDFKKMLDSMGLTQPLFELAWAGMASSLITDSFKSNYQYTLDDYERSKDSDYSYWTPSEEVLAKARAMIAFSEAFEVNYDIINS